MNDAADGFDADRGAILAKALECAVFDGFTPLMMRGAALSAGKSPAVLAAAFPRGAIGLVEYWSAKADAAAAAAIGAASVRPMRVREKIAHGVCSRLDYLRADKEAARRAAAFLALPHNAPNAMRLAWNTADAIWRAAGDQATDFNFYSKRAILTGVWMSTFARWLADDSPEEAATRAFLNARIENVMGFEKLKAKVRDAGFDPEGVFGWLAKLRYPGEGDAHTRDEGRIDSTLAESFPASDPPFWTRGVR